MEISGKLTKLLSLKKKRKSSEGIDSTKLDQGLAVSCQQFFNQKVEFHCVEASDSHLEQLKAHYKPLNKAIPEWTSVGMDTTDTSANNEEGKNNFGSGLSHSDEFPKPKKEIFDSKNLVMEWKEARGIGAGLYNMGNTCFLNSVLQCLVYTPPLYNYISSLAHKKKCHIQGFCVMCELQRHCSRVFNSQNICVKPTVIVHNLKAIAKQFRQGRQEDAHEFLRYFVDGLQKSSLQGVSPKGDPHYKATTVIHKIFGGYHRSQVKCLECKKTSDTFDPLLDISLDIKNCTTLLRALQKSTQADVLDGENSYACPICKKMTRAQKKFTIHRLPNVLTIQLKRFDYNSLFGGKINKSIGFDEYINMRPYMSSPEGPSEWYKLYAVLVHFGYSSHSGHYYCYIQNSNKIWYCMNDTQVSQVGIATVLSQEAYLLFYIKDSKYKPADIQLPPRNLGSHGHPPPRSSISTNNNNKVKSDPGFLGNNTIKHSTSNFQARVDKTGIPVAKINPKPTGIVNPSPHTSAATLDATTSPTAHDKGIQATPPPPTPSPATPSPKKSTDKGTSIEGVKEFSIPLRKTIVPFSLADTRQEKTSLSSGTPPPVTKPQTVQQEEKKPPTPLPAPPLFTPRQISAPIRAKKLPKLKHLSADQAQKKISQQIPTVKSIASQNLEQRKEVSLIKPSAVTDATAFESKPIQQPIQPPGFVALSEQTTPQTLPGITAKPEGRGTEPAPMSPPKRLASLHMSPFSLKQKVAMVSPLPHSGTGTKPVARVKPRLHLSPSGSKDETQTQGKDTPTPSTTPHIGMLSSLPVTSKSPNRSDHSSAAHGWKGKDSASFKFPLLGSDGHFSKPKKSKKKHKHRNHSPLDYESSESESDRRSRRHERRDAYEERTTQEVSRKRDRKEYSNNEGNYRRKHRSHGEGGGREKESSSRDRDHTSSKHHRQKKHKKYHKKYADRETEFMGRQRERGHKRDDSSRWKRSQHPFRTSSPLDQSSNSFENTQHRYREPQRHSSNKKRHLSGSTYKFHKSKHHLSSEEGRKERKRLYSDGQHDTEGRERSPSPNQDRHKHKKRKRDPPLSSVEERNLRLGPVPEVEWDAGGSTGGSTGGVWDGSKQSDTVEHLTSHSLDKLRSQVCGWDGEENSIDDGSVEEDKKKPPRDSWDKELDKGKVKNLKKVKNDFLDSKKNPFQDLQNKRNKLA